MKGKKIPNSIEIVPGVGARESVDFAHLLKLMYMRRAERHGLRTSVKGDVLTFDGEADYDIGRNESGVHRLVRTSPFDPEKRRHTSFAVVVVRGMDNGRAQRRSYIFEPYQQVRDYSGWVRGDVHAFLSGEVEGCPDEAQGATS